MPAIRVHSGQCRQVGVQQPVGYRASIGLEWLQHEGFAAEGLFGSGGPLADRFQAPTNYFEPNFTSDPIASNANSNYSKIYTFANAKATQTTLRSATTVYRFYSDNPNPPQSPTEPIREDNYFGSYYATQAYNLGVQAIQMLALDQSWYHPNLATMMRAETWLAGQAVVMGTAASIPQGILRPTLPCAVPRRRPAGSQDTAPGQLIE